HSGDGTAAEVPDGCGYGVRSADGVRVGWRHERQRVRSADHVELRYERVRVPAVVARVEGARRRREVRRGRQAGDIGVCGCVERDRRPAVVVAGGAAAATEEGGVE